MDLTKNEMVATLVFPIHNNSILLAQKTKKIGIGKWNGWGGEVEKNEKIKDAAVRELRDESGLSANKENLIYCGMVTFHNQRDDGSQFSVTVHIFLCYMWSGMLKVSDEMERPTFIPISRIPYHNMMPADQHWLPRVLLGKKVCDQYWYSPNQQRVTRQLIGHLNGESDVE